MKQMLLPLITEPPIWVWPLLVVLIVIGLRSSRDREVNARAYGFLPLMGIISIVSIAQAGADAATWAVFAAGYAAGAGFGWRAQGGIILSTNQWRAHLRGEWLTMATVMTIFWLRFVRAAMEAITPDVATGPISVVVFTTIAGGVAGIFMGRSLRTLHTVYRSQTRAS